LIADQDKAQYFSFEDTRLCWKMRTQLRTARTCMLVAYAVIFFTFLDQQYSEMISSEYQIGVRGMLDSTTVAEVPSKRKQEKILMTSFLFGEQAAKKKYLRMFIESARYAGIDIAIVGDHRPPYELPPNVRHVAITWDELVDRVNNRVFDGKEPGDLRSAHPYKVNDLKPLFAHLFPEEVKGYDWWGHCDNDMILGNLTHFLTQDLLEKSDIITPIKDHPTWGPFTMYRNSKLINELFRLSERPLKDVIASKVPLAFDEWGHMAPEELGDFYKSSISGIVDVHAEKLGLRLMGGNDMEGRLEIWDGFCKEKKRCAECIFHKGTIFYTDENEITH